MRKQKNIFSIEMRLYLKRARILFKLEDSFECHNLVRSGSFTLADFVAQIKFYQSLDEFVKFLRKRRTQA